MYGQQSAVSEQRNTGNLSAQPTARPLELPEVMQQQAYLTEDISKGLQLVYDRISPLLRPSQPPPASPNSGEIRKSFGAPLACAIDEQNSKLRGIDEAIQDILSRIEV